MRSEKISLKQYLDLVGYHATYKDCDINTLSKVSENYWLLELQLPTPLGGTHDELVHVDTLLDFTKTSK
jgi:hypothetical protein